MSIKVAIVGRPNVGKSTLFNRLAGRKIALVDDQPGVTRDRKEATGRLGDLDLQLIDTAGFEAVQDESLEARMRRQTERAIQEADVCVFLYDARDGVTPLDEEFGALLRRSGKPVVLAANKCEGKQGDAGLMEAWRLGLGEPAPISAEHGEGMAELYEGILAAGRRMGAEAPAEDETDAEEEVFDPDAEPVEDPKRPVRIAFVGRPNAGKSTLLNGILGDDRFITGPEAGITRDSVQVAWSWRDRPMQLVDTAGLRKRARVQEKLEKLSTHETIHAIRFAGVVVLVMDPHEAFEKQDVQIANLVLREGRALVFAITKWDMVDAPGEARREMERLLEHRIPQAKGAPIVYVSGVMGRGPRPPDGCLHPDRPSLVGA
ncbi:MAG: ribosome biogenesis GTPase Der [Hyphomonadaceae bacterium]